MKDMLQREIKVGDTIAYGLIVGRSANLAVYVVQEVLPDKLKVKKLLESYGSFSYNEQMKEVPGRHLEWKQEHPNASWHREEMSEQQKIKADNKLSTITMSERALIIDDNTKNLLNNFK